MVVSHAILTRTKFGAAKVCLKYPNEMDQNLTCYDHVPYNYVVCKYFCKMSS